MKAAKNEMESSECVASRCPQRYNFQNSASPTLKNKMRLNGEIEKEGARMRREDFGRSRERQKGYKMSRDIALHDIISDCASTKSLSW